MRAQAPLRRLRLFVATLALLAVGLVCSSASLSSAAGAKTVPLLRIGIPHPVNTFDVARDLSSLPYVAAMGLEPLLEVNPEGKFVGVLAQSVTYRGRDNLFFHLRKGVKFWDG